MRRLFCTNYRIVGISYGWSSCVVSQRHLRLSELYRLEACNVADGASPRPVWDSHWTKLFLQHAQSPSGSFMFTFQERSKRLSSINALLHCFPRWISMHWPSHKAALDLWNIEARLLIQVDTTGVTPHVYVFGRFSWSPNSLELKMHRTSLESGSSTQ